MLKSEWKEQPNWLNINDYVFMEGAKAPVWAWEFLRRNPEYRADWMRLAALKAEYGPDWKKCDAATVYSPEKHAGETAQAWMQRIAASDQDPVCKRLDRHLAEKWGLEVMCDPLKGYCTAVRFTRPGEGLPRILNTPDELMAYTDETDDGIQHIANRYMVVVIDATEPVEGLGVAVEKLARKRVNLMKTGGLKTVSLGRSNKTLQWLRHLRVLDALQAGVTHATIAEALGYGHPDDHVTSIEKQGEDFVRQARRMMRFGYRAAAFYQGPPIHIPLPDDHEEDCPPVLA